MPGGIEVNRHWIGVQRDGAIVLDWGDGRAVDLIQGIFIRYDPQKFSHPIQDDELETLKRMGMVSDYDETNVYLTSMPDDLGRKPLEE